MHKKNNYSPKFKVQTVLEGLKDPDGIAAFCRRKGITEVSFYNWQKQMINNASALFDKPSKATSQKIDRLEKEIQRKDRIISVVTEEALELKKKLSD